jgi:dynein heavy chain, axonemal
MKFLRFSYLIDFLAMHSLKNVYVSSVEEFKTFLRAKVEEPDVFLLKENVREFRSLIEPLFSVSLSHEIVPVKAVYKEQLEPFMLPPSGTNTIADFKILAHVNLKVPKRDKSSKVLEEDTDW